MKIKLVLTNILFIACFLLPNINFAQTDEIQYIDLVYLKDGSEFRGKIIEYKHDEYLKMEILGGQTVEFPAKQVRKVVQQPYGQSAYVPRAPKVVKVREYNFRESGIYNETYVNLIQGFNTWGEWVGGLGIHHVTGYQFNRWIGTGLGVGFDGYYLGFGENVIPVYAEARGYFMKKNTTPFYSVALGYGFAGKNDDRGITEASGGIMFNPNIGYRIGASAGANFTLSMGYKYQKASFTQLRGGGSTIKRNYTYSRLNLKLGLLF